MRHFLAKAVDQVNLRADRPLRTCGRRRNRLDDSFGRAELIGGLRYFKAALWMNNHANAGMLAAHALDVLRCEALVNRAVAFPQDHPSGADGFRRIAAELLIGIPDDHLVKWNAHTECGVAA